MMNIKAHGSEENYGIDRISSLPDDVRTHILSFLTTKQAVQTCILSKRWINTWTSVLDLIFDINEFWLRKSVDFGMAVEEVMTKFELLMRSVLEKRETSCVNRFQLCLALRSYRPCTQAIADCIGDVIKLGPRECLLKMALCENLNLNTDVIFNCASLIYLQLQLCRSTELDTLLAIEPNSVNLPCLKTLDLKFDGVTMGNDSFKKLLLGCPVVEELELNCCGISIIEICSNTLKKLVLRKCYDVMRLQISTPNLLYLDITLIGMEENEILLLHMPSLVDASICISHSYDQDKYVTMGPKLIHSLSNVESLRLEFDYPDGKALKRDFSDCPVFNNIKCLKLVNMGLVDFNLASFFLQHSPKLHELTFTNRHGWVPEYLDEETIQDGSRDALVRREFLDTVRIVRFKNYHQFVDGLIIKLLSHVKKIGKIRMV